MNPIGSRPLHPWEYSLCPTCFWRSADGEALVCPKGHKTHIASLRLDVCRHCGNELQRRLREAAPLCTACWDDYHDEKGTPRGWEPVKN